MNIILITVDCLRADHVSFLGYQCPTTPFLDQLAHESLVLERALVAGIPTYYSFPAILASRYPLALGRDVVGLAPDESTLATVLKEVGYTTAAFIAGNPYLCRRFYYHQGFDHFEDFLTPSAQMHSEEKPDRSSSPLRRRLNQALQRVVDFWPPARSLYNELYFHYCMWVDPRGRDGRLDTLRQYPTADVVVESALAWLSQQKRSPFFLWLHLMDPHHPYYPPAESLAGLGYSDLTPRQAFYLNETWKRDDISVRRLQRYRDRMVALYDAGIRWVDAQVKQLVEALQSQGLWDKTLFVLTSDHGEEFLEHGGRYHYPLKLTQELIHVPLLIRLPTGQVRGRVPGVFSLIDLTPTLLDILGIAQPGDLVGQSRWQGGSINNDPEALAITECVYNCRNPWRTEDRLGPRLLAIQDQRYKLVINFSMGEDWLFDLWEDPGETKPLPLNVARSIRRRLLEAALDHLRRSRPEPANRLRLRARVAELKHSLELSSQHVV